jgi:transposase
MDQVHQIGIDVSAASLSAVRRGHRGQLLHRIFANNATGHSKLIAWATRQGRRARCCVEATGVYSFDLAMTLSRHTQTEVMVSNPRAIKSFAQAMMQRAKTDATDAVVILSFVERMPFEPWCPPAEETLQLQAIMRRIGQLKVMLNQEVNRHHADSYRVSIEHLATQDIDAHMQQLEQRVEVLEQQGLVLIQASKDLYPKFKRLLTIKGVAQLSAMRILAEVMAMPGGLRPEQWVAQAGLDPRPRESGTSVNKPRFISRVGNKYLRHALYMPALVALRFEPQVKAFYQKLLAAGKKKMQAVVAVMRKLLRSIWGMIRYDQDFVGDKFYQIIQKGA